MKHFLYLIISLLFSSCLFQNDLNGVWSFELSLQGNKIPFYMKINADKVTLQNNSERVQLNLKREDKKIIIPIQSYDAAFELENIGNTLKGYWIKYNRKEEYKLPLFGMKTKFKDFQPLKESAFSNDLKMKLTFEDGNFGILTHKQGNTFSSIATETGDYRYLSSESAGESLQLWGFDGLFAFYIDAGYKLSSKRYEGKMYAGKSYSVKFIGEVDADFSLRDPTQITKFKGDLTQVKLPNLKGELKSIVKKGAPTVVQIFGSWCPNCIDETKYFLKWKSKNKNKNVNFVIVSFERAPTKKHALKLLRKTKNLYKIDYPILVASYTNEKKVTDIFKGMENFISFPTTLYIDKKGQVHKIHAGFNGPATGDFFEQFKTDFNKTIQELIQ
jgi:thiol-disulfide isomerase/thioredoxin